MLQFFRNSYFVNILMLVPYSFLLRIRSFVEPRAYASQELDSALFTWIYAFVESSPILQAVISVLLVFFAASVLNQLAKTSRLLAPIGLFPGVFYIVFMSFSPEMVYLHPLQFANVFALLALLFISNCFKKHQTFGNVFNVGFFISVAGLFYLPTFIFLIPGFIGILTIRTFRFKERIIYFIGLLTPIYFLFTYFYLKENISQGWNNYFVENLKFQFDFGQINERVVLATLSFFVLAILISVTRFYSISSKKAVHARKMIQVIYWFFIFTLPTIFLWHKIEIFHLQILAPFLGAIIGVWVFQWKNKGLSEVLHVFILLSLFALHFSDTLIKLIQ